MIRCFPFTALVTGAGGLPFIHTGLYPVGADDPHTSFNHWALDTLREHSIARASADPEVPEDMDTPERLLSGGADYSDMCAGCHLNPGKTQTNLTLGLYPLPPNLT